MTTPRLATDARNRAFRSFLQGFGIDIAVAVCAALMVWLPDADVSKKEAWLVLGTSLVKTVLQAGAAYVMRAKLDGSSIPTPLPPADPGEPDAVPGA
jgi:hypothetical protein